MGKESYMNVPVITNASYSLKTIEMNVVHTSYLREKCFQTLQY